MTDHRTAGAPTDLAAEVRRPADVQAVHHLKARYVRTLDHEDLASWGDVFVDDVVVELPESDQVEWPGDGGSWSGLRGCGHHLETYRHTGDGWRIAHLRLDRLHIEPTT